MKNTKLIAISVMFLASVAAFVFWRGLQPTEKKTAAAPSHQTPARAASTAQTAGTPAPSVAATSQKEIVGAASHARPAGARTARISTQAEKNAGLLDPELREYVTRRVAKEYAPLFARLQLSPVKQELLEKILVDWMLTPEFSEMGDYDRLAAELLTQQEYAVFLSHRAELAMKDWVKAAATATGVGGLTDGDVTRQAVEKIIRSAPLNNDAIWKDADSHLTRGGQLSEADLAALAATATQHFESALATGAAQLSPEQLRLLRAWFQKAVVDFNLRALRNSIPRGP